MPSPFEVYLRTRKPRDLVFNSFIARPLASPIVAALADGPVTPNQVTLAACFVAAAAAGLLIVLPGYWGLVAAVLVYEFSYVLDCVDGMLARWRGIASTPGHLLDFLMDEIKAFMILGAAAIRLHREHGGDLYLLAGIVGLVALASGIGLTTFLRRPEIAGPAPSAGQARRGGLIGLLELLAQQLIHYPSYIILVALAGRLDLYFWPYIAVNCAYAGKTFLGVALRFGLR